MPGSSQQKTIVITGCSSGFGRATALRLAQSGWLVFATVRKEADAADLLGEAATLNCKENILPQLCDITSAEQVAALGQTVAATTPRLDALLNNAGTAFAAPLELLSLDDLRAQLEINVVAHVAVTQALLPLLKAARGIIINVSSVAGLIATPVVGAYAASKHAMEAISDTWRVELAHFGVRVVLIEPSDSSTNIWETSLKRAERKLESYRNGPYEPLLATAEKAGRRSEKHGFPPRLFADTVLKILRSRHPRPRYIIPSSFTWVVALHRLLPDALWDRLIRLTLRW